MIVYGLGFTDFNVKFSSLFVCFDVLGLYGIASPAHSHPAGSVIDRQEMRRSPPMITDLSAGAQIKTMSIPYRC